MTRPPDMEVIEHHRQAAPPPPSGADSLDWLNNWLQRPGTATTILVLSLLLTGLAWLGTRHFAIDDARQRFERRADEVQGRIERRMASYETLLRDGVALFASQGEVTRESWRRYAQMVQPETRYPGIQGFGVSRLLRPSELAAHEAAQRAEGFRSYQVRPAGGRDAYSAIVYLEPLDKRNLRAIGFDMMSEPTRRAAMERARDSGEAALSGIVTLVQEDGKNVQKGFLLYLPVYHGGAMPATLEGRRKLLLGWVYAPFRVTDLMQGILGKDVDSIAFRIRDQADPTGQSAFYDSAAATASKARPGRMKAFERQVQLQLAGRHWAVQFNGSEADSAADTWQSNLVALAGVSTDLLLYWSIAQLARRKRHAEQETELRSAEADRRTAWLDAVSDLSPNATLVFDRTGQDLHRLVFTNPTFSQLFELRPDDLLGLSEEAVNEWLSGLVGEDATAPPLAWSEGTVVLAGPPVRVLERRMRESGQQRVYYFRDTTRETEVERLKTQFLTTAAHELRTPLASVYGFSELLMNDKVDPAKRQRAVAIVHRQAGVLKHLVDELLDLARLDSRRDADFRLGVFNLHHVVREAVESVLRPDQAPRVLIAPCDSPLWVQADMPKMRQVLLNLVSNGLKYSPEDSIVMVRTSVPHSDGRDWARVSVEDQGIGMSPDELARATERFFRADPSGHIPGTGLGLSIAKEIIELHRGRLHIRSRPGEGTAVSVDLPMCDAPSGRHEPEAPAQREEVAA
ncbi:histidine kinase,histidine kinase,CHASE domain-containing protein [Burkholderiales bacterium JOSHI_001]|nr:histidine kinase,histidine kinase,CHASE domain-containing protein [Burkholderiales bacterium JOSHI_001]